MRCTTEVTPPALSAGDGCALCLESSEDARHVSLTEHSSIEFGRLYVRQHCMCQQSRGS